MNDYQCAPTHFCWFQTAEDVQNNVQKCMAVFNEDDGAKFGWKGEADTIVEDDFKRNGMFCKSGMAFNSAENEATCVSAKQIKFADKAIDPALPAIESK